MPSGICKKKESFDYFHWTGEDDDDELFDWLINSTRFMEGEIAIKNNFVVYCNEYWDGKEAVVFDMNSTPYLVLTEDWEVLEFSDAEFNARYEVQE